MIDQPKSWRYESNDELRREILRRGEEITYLANHLEITERRLKVANETIAILAKRIKKMEQHLENNADSKRRILSDE